MPNLVDNAADISSQEISKNSLIESGVRLCDGPVAGGGMHEGIEGAEIIDPGE